MKYWTTYLLIRAESNEWGIVMEQMLTAVVDRSCWPQLLTMDRSCIVDHEQK